MTSTSLAAPAASIPVPTIPAAEADAVKTHYKVMTYNLKFASEGSSHPWSQRRRLIRNAILQNNPDLIGTQEGLFSQLSNIAEDLSEYNWIGEGRDGHLQGEFTAIFYKKARFEPLQHGSFWLSSTPLIPGSKTWGNWVPRMVTWVLFKDKTSGARFYHFNTHFDHIVPYARMKSAELLTRQIEMRNPDIPAIVTGDFNTSQAGGVHKIFTPTKTRKTLLFDSWDAAPVREGILVSTYHAWHGPRNTNRRIDWILASPDFLCTRSRVVLYKENGQWPSDHFPVVSDLNLTIKPAKIATTARSASNRV